VLLLLSVFALAALLLPAATAATVEGHTVSDASDEAGMATGG